MNLVYNIKTIYKQKSHFDEKIEIKEFKYEIEQILEKENNKFKIKRIKYVDTEFKTELDLPKFDFIFENRQIFSIYCEAR